LATIDVLPLDVDLGGSFPIAAPLNEVGVVRHDVDLNITSKGEKRVRGKGREAEWNKDGEREEKGKGARKWDRKRKEKKEAHRVNVPEYQRKSEGSTNCIL